MPSIHNILGQCVSECGPQASKIPWELARNLNSTLGTLCHFLPGHSVVSFHDTQQDVKSYVDSFDSLCLAHFMIGGSDHVCCVTQSTWHTGKTHPIQTWGVSE